MGWADAKVGGLGYGLVARHRQAYRAGPGVISREGYQTLVCKLVAHLLAPGTKTKRKLRNGMPPIPRPVPIRTLRLQGLHAVGKASVAGAICAYAAVCVRHFSVDATVSTAGKLASTALATMSTAHVCFHGQHRQ